MLKENTYLNRRVLTIIEKTKGDFPDLKLTVTTKCPVFHSYSGCPHLHSYNSGCHVAFEDTPYSLSIQTNTDTIGPSFCETTFLKEGTMVYRDFMIHMTEESLENHLIFFFSKIQEQAKTGDFSLIKLD